MCNDEYLGGMQLVPPKDACCSCGGGSTMVGEDTGYHPPWVPWGRNPSIGQACFTNSQFESCKDDVDVIIKSVAYVAN